MLREILEVLKAAGIPVGGSLSLGLLGFVGYKMYEKKFGTNGKSPKVTEYRCEERMKDMRKFIMVENTKQNEVVREQYMEQNKILLEISTSIGEVKGLVQKK